MDENLSNLFGLAEEEYEQSPGQQLFHPEQILYQDKKTETPVSVVNRPVNVAPVSSGAKEEDYLKEIAELRQRLREEERKSRYFKEQQNQASIRLRELEATVEKYKSEQDELVALRNYVYESSEEVPRVEKQSYEAMKAAIADRRIVIIGGNDNWVKKLRQEFPGWVYMGARVSGSINSTNVQNAERVYFFTDALGHSNYNKFMQVVRRLQLPFGYMHGVNIYANVAQIYRDFKSEE
jgi:mRNA-degrading endonuclease HigB of HigAB toxin-antitoxin module